ncbi:beta-ketoacyl-ACP reductase [Streptomyces fodineus]|uniref:Beta-ketoacyl-ACP reductase n=1 Tax=Streptomyces fodineus TaxID=1904616 RepID=A0A1D7YFE6_9ACTN|nr:3-oxoacyl-ACP reductase FabG [Streptomyces fodineus]AOR34234.1 beta-ketoacyl-ACP reductase [Streptomyces fodineus]
MSNAVAIVTGAGQGIGAAIARRLAFDGMSVAVLERVETATVETVEAIRANGGTAVGIACDVTRTAEVDAMADLVAARLGPADVLVNNAGITRDNLLFAMGDDDWDEVIDVHLHGSFRCARAVGRHMREQGHGRIVNVSSVAALGNPGQANYATAKAGIQGLTRTLAIELGPSGITVNAVAPGFVHTAMTDAVARRIRKDPAQLRDAAASRVPLRRVGVPEDIAGVVAFLAGPDAGYLTGQTIQVDGGPQ